MTGSTTIKPVRGVFGRDEGKVSIDLEFATDAEAEAAFAAIVRAARKGQLNIVAGALPASIAQEPRG